MFTAFAAKKNLDRQISLEIRRSAKELTIPLCVSLVTEKELQSC